MYFYWHVHVFGHNQASASISGLWHSLSQRGTVSGDFFPLVMAPVQPEACSHLKRGAVCQCDHCVRIQENRQVVVIAGQARDTLVKANQT